MKTVYVGVDGEGQGREDHRYVLLAASTEDRSKQWYVENFKGLSTVECFEFLLNLPKSIKPFAYAFNYDLTKMLTDLDDESLYLLFRPELRQRKGAKAKFGPWPIKWKGYKINLQATRFTIRHGSRKILIWDVFKFFQGKFVGALKDWKVGDKNVLERMQEMKDKRSEFDKESPEAVRAYCFDECAYMAELARKLTEAHETMGLTLKAYYGAGSSAAAMLKVMGIQRKIEPTPIEMQEAVACAFFGGRFENSVIGRVEGTVYSYDISSAYPYQLTFLPCLIHGKWKLTKHEQDLWKHPHALVHYRLNKIPKGSPWGPYPYRDSTGSISFPKQSPGGWIWREEFLRGKQLFPDQAEFREAWVYETECDCQPFKDIPRYYLERIKLGKDGPGIVIKLAVNSCYGKLAQSIGRAVFNSWIWAGMITSGCRAQMLEMLLAHKDRANLLMIATDGAYSREQIRMPNPKDTGTSHVSKPLGGWEEKIIDKGVFVARPGIYFPMNPTVAEIKDVRGRGVGKGVVLENWKTILEAYESKEEGIHVANVSRFIGAKTAISVNAKGTHFKRGKEFGQWLTRPVFMSFDPRPKRAKVIEGNRLALRSFRMSDPESVVYSRAMKNLERDTMQAYNQELLEQPDADFSDYEQH